MKNINTLILFLLLASTGFGQSLSPRVTATAGGRATGGGVSLSYTTGETFNTNLSANNKQLSQGQQQPEIDLRVGIAQAFACAGNNISVPFTADGYVDEANTFKVQLSDANGSFANAVTIGSTTSLVSGNITATVPAGLNGSGYKARVVSSNPSRISSDLVSVTVNTIPNAAATITQPTCGVATGNISITSPVGAGLMYSIGGAYQSSLTFSGVQPGAYNVSVQNSSGCSSVQSTSVTVNAQPFIPVVPNVTGQTNVCNVVGTGVAVSFTANSAGATSYTWTLPANTILVSGQGTATVAVKFLSGFTTQANKQIKVTATSVCGTSTQKTYYLSAQLPGTPAQIVASTTDVCPSLGTNVPVTYKIPKVMGAAGYIWAAQAGTTILTPSSNWGENDTVIAVNFANNFTSSIVTVQSFNDCGVSGTRSLTIYRNNPATPGLISGPANACAYIGTNGADVTYSVSAVSGVTAYNWTLPSGVTNVTGQGTNSISFRYPAGFTSGILSVRSSNGCGTSGTRSLSISTLTPSYPGRIDVINLAACPSRIYSYTISSMPSNAVSLLWTVPAGGSIVSGQGTTSIVVEYTSGVIAGNVGVVAVANCGNSLPRVTEVKLAACPSGLTSPIAMKNDNNTEDKNLEVKVYPNPTTAEFRMQVITAGRNELSVKIMDVQGRNIRSFVVAPNQTTAFGNELKAGVYMLEVREGKRVRTERVVKY